MLGDLETECQVEALVQFDGLGRVYGYKVRFVWQKDRSRRRTVKAQNRVDTLLLELLEKNSCAAADMDDARRVEGLLDKVGDDNC